jgi:hypothetical protein
MSIPGVIVADWERDYKKNKKSKIEEQKHR